MLAGVAFSLFDTLPRAASVARWFPAFLAFSAVVTAACAIGALFMQRWSVYAYTAWHVVVTAIGILVLARFSVTAFIVRCVLAFLLFCLLCLPRQRPNQAMQRTAGRGAF